MYYILSTLSQTLNFTSPPRLYLPNRPQLSLIHCFHQKPLSVSLPPYFSVIAEATSLTLVSTFCSLFPWPVSQEDFCDLKIFRVDWIFKGFRYQILKHVSTCFRVQYALPYWFYFQVISWPVQDYLGDDRRHLLDTKDICQICICKAKWWGHEMQPKRQSPEIFNKGKINYVSLACFSEIPEQSCLTFFKSRHQRQILYMEYFSS